MDPHESELPDMTLPDAPASTNPAPRNPSRSIRAEIAAGHPTIAPNWRVGDRVFAPREPAYVYAGVIERIVGATAFIRFQDGDTGPAAIDKLQPLAAHVGQRVHCRIPMTKNYFPATVCWVDGDAVTVEFDRGGEERTTIAALRIPAGGDIFSGGLSPSAQLRVTAPADSGSGWPAMGWIIPFLVWIAYAYLNSIR